MRRASVNRQGNYGTICKCWLKMGRGFGDWFSKMGKGVEGRDYHGAYGHLWMRIMGLGLLISVPLQRRLS